MKKLEFEIMIDAPRERVWDVLWGNETYPQWTLPFNESGSFAETDWKKGSKVLFIDNKRSGMVSTIQENIPDEFMSIRHLGEIIEGKEDLESDRVKAWAGALENYTLTSEDGKTKLQISTDTVDEFEKMFKGIWPKALQKLKEISEAKS